MNLNTDKPDPKELDTWVKKTLNTAVNKFMYKGHIDSSIVKAKPVWVLPYQILIGKIQVESQPQSFTWVICGELPTDFLEGAVATTPKDIAKHFSLKWQLTATQFQKKDIEKAESQPQQDDAANNLVSHAEALYKLTEDERLWQLPDNT
jgi:hypothetical protein